MFEPKQIFDRYLLSPKVLAPAHPYPGKLSSYFDSTNHFLVHLSVGEGHSGLPEPLLTVE